MQKKYAFLFLILLFTNATFAQIFGGFHFEGVKNGSTIFADVDGDNDEDVFVVGTNDLTVGVAKLYKNNGNGSFNLIETPAITALSSSAAAFADIDGDNDLDLMMSGLFSTSSSSATTKLYTNDGSGNFTPVTGTSLTGLYNGTIDFADIDGDNDLDVLLTGMYDFTGFSTTKLYENDGNGNFTLVTGTIFDNITLGDIAFADIDGDNDQDVLITGFWGGAIPIANLYTNDGNGNFTLVPTTLTPVKNSSIDFADVDNDNDLDVLITGQTYGQVLTTKLFINNGVGNFTISTTSFSPIAFGAVKFAEVNGDNYVDVLITGQSSNSIAITELYLNNGSGAFNLVTTNPFQGVANSSVMFRDVNDDNFQDVIISGQTNSSTLITKLYRNDGNGNFIDVLPFAPVHNGSAAAADIDGDNDEDIVIIGSSTTANLNTELYVNNGIGFFNAAANIFNNLSNGDLAFSDIDGDNDPDILITGTNFLVEPKTELYQNIGNGNFVLVANTPFVGVTSSSVAFSDIDGDNDEDVLISGVNINNQVIANLYTNDGNGNFTMVANTSFDGISNGDIEFSDIDGDNDPDVLITGENIYAQRVAKLYQNNGAGSFTLLTNTPFDAVSKSAIAFSDIDGDNDNDLILTGLNNFNQRITKLYANNGLGVFSLLTGTPFYGISDGDVKFTDVDNDNDQDLIISGGKTFNTNSTELYLNDGNGNFMLDNNTPFADVTLSAITFIDIDGDTDKDVFITGFATPTTTKTTYLYENLTINNIFISCPLEWDFSLDICISENNLIKGSNNSNWSNIRSTEFLLNNQNGWIQTEIAEMGTARKFGFSHNNTTPSNNIDYSFYFHDTDSVTVYEFGINKGISGNYNTGDIFKIMREGNTLTYLQNDTIFYVSTASANGDIYAAATILDYEATLYNTYASFSCLNFEPPTDMSICSNQSALIGNTYYTTPGIYPDTLSSITGCDSIVFVNLIVNPVSNVTINQNICHGESYSIANSNYTTTGTYVESLQTWQGCDSTITLNLTVNPVVEASTYMVICPNEFVLFGGNIYSTTGTYNHIFQTWQGCDSTVTLFLTVTSITQTNIDTTICPNEFIVFGGNIYNTTGTYNHTLQTWQGCDSIVTINLFVQPTITIIDTTITDGGNVSLGSIDITPSGSSTNYQYQWSTGATTQNVSGLGTGFYTLTVTDNVGCSETFSFEIGVVNTIFEHNLSSLQLFPTPNNGQFYLDFKGFENGNYTIEIYNTVGQMIYHENQEITDDGQKQYHIPNSKGLYYLKLYPTDAPEQSLTRSFIIR